MIDDQIKPGIRYTLQQLVEVGLKPQPKITDPLKDVMEKTNVLVNDGVFADANGICYFCIHDGSDYIPRNIVKPKYP